MTEKELNKEVEKIAESKQSTNEVKSTDPLFLVQEELARIKSANDALEAEHLRSEELRARALIAGKAKAGEPEKSPQMLADEEAEKILKAFRG